MSLFSFSSKKQKSLKVFWRVDSGAISVMVTDEKDKVHYYDSEKITIFAMDDRHMYDQLLHHTELCMKRIIPGVVDFLGTVPDSIAIVLGEPWAHSIGRHIVYKRKTRFKLTKSFISDLIVRDMKRIKKEYADYGTDFIEPVYHGISIAGHLTNDPWGKIVDDIRFDYITGLSDDRIVGLVKKTLNEGMRAPLNSISFDHYQNFLVRFWKKTNLSHGLLIDGSGFITELYIFKQNQLVQIGTLPLGFAMVRNELASYLGIYPRELEALLSLYQKKLISEDISRKIQSGLVNLYTIWEKDFQKFCNHAIEQGDILDQVVWSGDEQDPIVQFFMHQLASNTLQFPVVFGTNQVGFLHNGVLARSLNQDTNMTPNAHNADQVIIAGIC